MEYCDDVEKCLTEYAGVIFNLEEKSLQILFVIGNILRNDVIKTLQLTSSIDVRLHRRLTPHTKRAN